MINSEIWDSIINWIIIFSLWMKILAAFGTVADWITLDQIFFINLNISFPEWSKVLWCICSGILASWMGMRITSWDRFVLG
jgi:hypothetical protein